MIVRCQTGSTWREWPAEPIRKAIVTETIATDARGRHVGLDRMDSTVRRWVRRWRWSCRQTDQWIVPTIVQYELSRWLAREMSDAAAARAIAFSTELVVVPLDDGYRDEGGGLCERSTASPRRTPSSSPRLTTRARTSSPATRISPNCHVSSTSPRGRHERPSLLCPDDRHRALVRRPGSGRSAERCSFPFPSFSRRRPISRRSGLWF